MRLHLKRAEVLTFICSGSFLLEITYHTERISKQGCHGEDSQGAPTNILSCVQETVRIHYQPCWVSHLRCSSPIEPPENHSFSWHQVKKICQIYSTALVYSGCCSRIPQTEWLTNKLLSQSFGGQNVKDQYTGRFTVWWRPAAWFIECHLPTAVSHGKRGKGTLWVSFIRVHLIHKSSILMT